MKEFFLKLLGLKEKKAGDVIWGECLPAREAREVGRGVLLAGLVELNEPHIARQTHGSYDKE